jgi:hypothetical protein
MKAVDRFRFVDPKHQTNIRFYAAMYLGCLLTNSASPSAEEIASVNSAGATDDIVQKALKRVMDTYDNLGASDQVAKGVVLLAALKMELGLRFPKARRDGP